MCNVFIEKYFVDNVGVFGFDVYDEFFNILGEGHYFYDSLSFNFKYFETGEIFTFKCFDYELVSFLNKFFEELL